MRLGKAPLCAAIRTLSFRACNIHREYSAQFTRGCISVKVVHGCTHFSSPVAPKHSVLMFSRPWPAAISRSVAFSTNDLSLEIGRAVPYQLHPNSQDEEPEDAVDGSCGARPHTLDQWTSETKKQVHG